MPWRQYDFECPACEWVHTDLIMVPTGEDAPKASTLEDPCEICKGTAPQRRILSAPAKYTYDTHYAPAVTGGKFDTQGGRRAPKLPELPPDADFDQARDMFASKEYKDRVKDRWAVKTENAQKRARAAAMKKHPTMDIRNTPLPGDPKNG